MDAIVSARDGIFARTADSNIGAAKSLWDNLGGLERGCRIFHNATTPFFSCWYKKLLSISCREFFHDTTVNFHVISKPGFVKILIFDLFQIA